MSTKPVMNTCSHPNPIPRGDHKWCPECGAIKLQDVWDRKTQSFKSSGEWQLPTGNLPNSITGVVLCKGELFLTRNGKTSISLVAKCPQKWAQNIAKELGVPFSEE